LAEGDRGGEAEAIRDDVEALRHTERHRAGAQQPRMPERAQRQPLPAGGDALLDQGLPGALHQPPVRDVGRTRRLAPAALHAGLERVDHLVGERRVVQLHLPHQGDAAARRHGFVAGHPERRARRQAESALHARVQFVVVDPEIHP